MATSPDSPVRAHPAAAYHARRRSEVDAKILTTARQILNTEGLAALTVERVAADSGVAKTTIYRRFKHRLDLATAAIGDLPQAFREEGPADTKQYLKGILSAMSTGMKTRSGEVIGAGLMYRHDEDFSPLYRERVVDARTSAVRPRLAAAVSAGELRSDLDIDLVMAMLGGAVIAGHLMGVDERAGWENDAIDLLWPSIAA